ncbi:MAG TPA: hydrolase 1, exosortase A system-associated [Duganella sp.]|jgi:exosortase A-associated hydrolase 1
MSVEQQALLFKCRDCWLVGVLHRPSQPSARGVLIVTGGPQYRVGSHRQFVLLARHLAAAGIPVMRFDYRGMGDSDGAMRGFDKVDDDLRAAIQQFFLELPAMKDIVLWGLCDGATASAFYAPKDARVSGLVLLNPWVRTEQGLAQATLSHYYVRRMFAREFWRKLVSGAFGLRESVRSLVTLAAAARRHAETDSALPARLRSSLSTFRGRVLIILSGADIGAREFSALGERHAEWRALLSEPRVRQAIVAQANHTFGRKVWRDDVAALCADWIGSW